MLRRAVLSIPLAALVAPVMGRATDLVATRRATRVAADADRENQKRMIGLSDTAYKVMTKETAGDMFVMEQSNHVKGGPPRHLHHGEDELFLALEGDYVIEIGPDRFHLKPGDCVLGPRGIPHAWAFAGSTTGRMLITFAPAGKMEAFFDESARRGAQPGKYASDTNGPEFLKAFGLERVGPPIALNTL